MHVCLLDIAINALPCKEMGACFFYDIGITHMQSLGPCENPREISKLGTKESWMQKALFPKYWQLASDHAICSLPGKYCCYTLPQHYPLRIKKERRALFLL